MKIDISSRGNDLEAPLLMPDSHFSCDRDPGDDENIVQESTDGRPGRCLFETRHVCQLIGLDSVSPYFTSKMLHLAMISNFSTSYNFVNVTYVMDILDGNPSYQAQLTPALKSICASSLIIGMITGQLVGGLLGDYTTRTKALVLAMTTQIVCSVGSALAFSTNRMSVLQMLVFWRFFLGIGCGGVYPLVATMTSEIASSEKVSSKLVALTFSTQGLGFFCAPLVTWLLATISHDPVIWRIILGLGCLPGIIILIYWRCCSCSLCKSCFCRLGRYENVTHVSDGIGEEEEKSSVQKADASHDETGALPLDLDKENPTHVSINENVQIVASDCPSSDVTTSTSSSPGVIASIRQESNLCRKLCGTALSWFVFDILFYGNTLFSSTVLKKAFGPKETVLDAAKYGLILALMALPGYCISVIAIGKFQTPRYVQLQGFALIGILFGVIGFFFEAISQNKVTLLLLYGLTFFFANYGPNTTTFMMPSLTFSPRCRSTLNGVSAACGKLGALLGAAMFEPATDLWGDGVVMKICASLSAVGFVLTYLCVSTNDMKMASYTNDATSCSRAENTRFDFELL